MKKILIFLLVVTSASTQAQEYKKFKFGIGLAPVIYLGTNSSFGGQIYFEPTFRITDNLAVSYKVDVNARFENSTTFDTQYLVTPSISNTFNAQYYFTSGKFRPFAGFGLGLFTSFGYNYYTFSSSSNSFGIYSSVPAASKFGFYPRVGFDLAHFNLSIDYNIVPGTEFVNNSTFRTQTISNSYMAVRFGVSIGGGKVK